MAKIWLIRIGITMLLLGAFGCQSSQRQTNVPLDIHENQPSEETKSDYIYIDLKGEVRLPGVYKVSRGSRLYQVIDRAGGLTNQADILGYNLSQKLTDEQVIMIPSIYHRSDSDDNGLISISSASLETLMTLPNIGPATAQAIIDYRTQNGSFNAIEEIMNVRNIGRATFEAIEPYISP